jgi:hypothetical protein
VTSGDWTVLAAWSAWTGVLAVGVLVWSGDGLAPALLGGVALGALLLAGLRASIGEGPEERTLVDTSAAPPSLAIGLTLVANGIAFGLWLVLVGLELIALGGFLLLRDRRAAP